MKPQADLDSPFAPGFGITPPYAPGREELTHDTLRRARRGFHTIVVGPRGVGKTVWLNEVADHVHSELDGHVITWNAGDPDRSLSQAIAEQASGVERHLTRRLTRAFRRVDGSVTVKAAPAGIGAEASTKLVSAREPSAGSVTQQLTRLAELARRRGRLVLLQVDELQSASPRDIVTLGTAVQTVANEARLPVVLVAAGLPSTKRALLLAAEHTERAPSMGFLERQNFQWIGNLDHEAAIEAIETPIRQAGWTIDGDALETMAEASAGYPYAIQLIGEHAWEAAARPGHVCLHDARQGIELAYRQLADTVYEPRWRSMSPAEQRYSEVVASVRDHNGVASFRDVLVASGDTVGRATDRQWQLVNRHQVLEVDENSNVRFTIPGFADWISARSAPRFEQAQRRTSIGPDTRAALVPPRPAIEHEQRGVDID